MPPDFRFQTILNFRKRTEDERQMELAKSLQTVADLRARLEATQTEREQVAENLKETLQGALDPGDIQLRYRYLDSVDAQLAQLAQGLSDAEEEVLRQRYLLADAMKARKTIEKLKENDEQRYVTDRLQKEQKEVDERNVTRRSRQM